MSGRDGIGRRGVLGLSLGALVAGCSRADGGKGTLLAGDQKGGSKAVLEASHNLDRLPYRIEWSAFPNSAPLLEALNAGAVDTGTGSDSAFIFATGTGAAIKVIGAQKYEGSGSILVVRRDSAIHSLNDIAGRRIATPKGSVGHNFMLAALEAQGRPLDAVQFAFLSPQDGNAALLSGAVDGWAIWDPIAAIAEKQGARLIFDEGLVPSYAVLFGSDPAIATKRPLLTDYKHRLYQGWNWAATHSDDYARRLQSETGIPSDIWRTVMARAKRLPASIDATLIANQQKTADRYVRAGLLDRPIDVKIGFDRTFS